MSAVAIVDPRLFEDSGKSFDSVIVTSHSAGAGERTRRLQRNRRNRRRRRISLSIDIGVVAIVLAVVVVGLSLFRVAEVPSASMAPTLPVGSDILIHRELGGAVPHRGQIITFTDPGGWLSDDAQETAQGPLGGVLDVLTGTNTSHMLVKRVIGLPGDHVTGTLGGTITVDGTKISEPYANAERGHGAAFDVHVQPGCLFVLGDDRGNSVDSRYHLSARDGCVPIRDVYGTVAAITWPSPHVLTDDTGAFARVRK